MIFTHGLPSVGGGKIGSNLLNNSEINLLLTDSHNDIKLYNGKFEIIGNSRAANAYAWLEGVINGGTSGLIPGKYYTVSVDIKVTGAQQDIDLTLDFRIGSSRKSRGVTKVDHTKDGEWARYAVSCQFVSAGCNRILTSIDTPIECGIGTTVEYRNWKLEEGSVATDLLPTPEDMVASISALESRVAALEAKVN